MNGHSFDDEKNTICPYCPLTSKKAAPPTERASGDKVDIPTPPPPPPFEISPPIISQNVVNENKTVRIRGASQNASQEQSISHMNDPVVGWLIVVEGEMVGQDYRLVSGWNSVGRDGDMSVSLDFDPAISRRDHVKILFEPKKQQYHISPGEARNPSYVNNEVLLQPMIFNDRDIIELGGTKLKFIALCGAGLAVSHNW